MLQPVIQVNGYTYKYTYTCTMDNKRKKIPLVITKIEIVTFKEKLHVELFINALVNIFKYLKIYNFELYHLLLAFMSGR